MFTLDYISAFFVFIIIGVPTLMISIELLLGQFIPKKVELVSNREPCVILIPAHNEELIILDTLIALIKETHSDDKILVIADNCSDRTVKICRDINIEVIERNNKEFAGKGYALDFGIQHVRALSEQPKTIVVLDADCEFELGSLDILVTNSQQKNAVIQSLYLMKSSVGASIKSRVAEFAWLVKNKIRPTGLARLKVGCHLQGSGTAFPWRLFSTISFASGSIVEDLELGLKLANLNEQAIFEPQAIVISFFPESTSGAETQRTRWEHGHLSAISLLPKMMMIALSKGEVKVFLLSLDAAIPPTVLWLMFVILANFVGLVLYFFGLSVSLIVSVFMLFILMFSLGLSWYMNGRNIIRPKDIIGIIGYIFSKFSIYKKFFTARQKEWVRTERDDKYGQ